MINKFCVKNLKVTGIILAVILTFTGCGKSTAKNTIQLNSTATGAAQDATSGNSTEAKESEADSLDDNAAAEETSSVGENASADGNVSVEENASILETVSAEEKGTSYVPQETRRYITDTVQESGEPQVTDYLGVTVTTTTINVYNIYSDGTKEFSYSTSSVSTNRDGYNATDDQLKAFSQGYAASYAGYYEQVLSLVNQIRSEVGVSPLSLDSTLCLAATMRSTEMDLKNYFAHTRADGSNCFSIFSYFGYGGTIGENIAAGYSSPEQVVEGWKNSPGHYANMIKPEFTRLGVGLSNLGFGDYGMYWTQLFSS